MASGDSPNVDIPTITTRHGSADELAAASLLGDLLDRYDAGPWRFTDRVVFDERCAIPHSHPVLTLSPMVIWRQELGMLAMYLHEQIHWQLVAQRRQVSAARRDLKRMFPNVPDQKHGGAKNRRSTYLHLLVNWLEAESVRTLATDVDGYESAYVDGPVYGWVYRQVFERHDDLAAIVTEHDLLGPLKVRPLSE